MIDAHEGKLHRPGSLHAQSFEAPLGVAQVPRYPPVGRGAREGIEIAAKHTWRAELGVPKPFRAGDGFGLPVPLASVEPEVGGHHLDFAPLQFYLGPQGAAALGKRVQRFRWERAGLHKMYLRAAKNGVAVAALFNLYGGAEMEGHLERHRNEIGLVDPVGADQACIQFLQCDDVRVVPVDDLCDPQRGYFAVHADATVDVVGHHGKGF